MAKTKRNHQRKAKFTTISELDINEIYRRSDVSGESLEKLSEAGEFPFTRGVHSNMYRGRLWTMRQYAGFGTAQETNQRFHFLIRQGTTGLSTAFDLPTQMGRDPDHKLSHGEVGRVGVSISTLDDMRLLLNDIPLDKVSISMTINATAAILLAMLLVVAEEREVSWKMLSGTVQNDVLKEYVARGTYIYPPASALRVVTDIISFCSSEVPRWNTISISGYHMREAGCTAVQELAFTLANAITYCEAALKKGLNIDDFAPRLAFFFNCHNEFLEEIAKFRAARRLWAQIVKERFKAKKPESMMLRFHTQTAGSSLVAQQPENNIVRTTLQALAAVLGGTQSLHTNSFDEALGLPTEHSAQIALRTQQIIAHESGVSDTVDPFGGSYLMENWTSRLEHEAMKLISEIESKGGMLRAIEGHFPQEEIDKAAYRFQRSVENKERIIVGMNDYIEDDSVEVHAPYVPNANNEREAIATLNRYKQGRSQERVMAALLRVRDIAKGPENLMPAVIDAVRSHATLGEISDALRDVFGNYDG